MAHRVLILFGTRPEAIKLCPLISAIRNSASEPGLQPVVCVTGQHREMLRQVLQVFDVAPDFDLDVMQRSQTLPALTARLIAALEPVFTEAQPDLAVVQGDTSTTLAGALSAFFARVPLAHVEAGLRTFDLARPFPEEGHRVLTTRLATLHFAATEGAAAHLRREHVASDSIEVTGNTGIDAVLSVASRLESGELSGLALPLDWSKKVVVVTAHRRESFGPPFRRICEAVGKLAEREDVQIVWPVHRNPNVVAAVNDTVRGRKNILLLEPLTYVSFVDLMRRSHLLLTDSGGIQEEGPSLGKPVLVLREKTERPEAVEAGTVKLVGSDPATVIGEATRLLDDPAEYARMSRKENPYGDGRASERIVRRISTFLSENRAT